MLAATALEEPPTEDALDRPDPVPAPGRWTLRRAAPLVAMAAGLLVIAVAGAIAINAGDADGTRDTRDTEPAATAPMAITVSAPDVSVVTQVYEPGEDGGWHAHPGIHAVAVLSGVLTVYDGDCQRQTYEPGRPYVGGQLAHLVRNETAEPVVMAVTYLNPRANTRPTERLQAPAGCAVGP